MTDLKTGERAFERRGECFHWGIEFAKNFPDIDFFSGSGKGVSTGNAFLSHNQIRLAECLEDFLEIGLGKMFHLDQGMDRERILCFG